MRRDEEDEKPAGRGSGGEGRAEGVGPFTTRLTLRGADGSEAVWDSRTVRRRGALTVRAAGDTRTVVQRADAPGLARMRALNSVAAVAFTLGGLLFAAGATLAIDGAPANSVSSTYFAGGLLFNAGGYASLLQAVNTPRRTDGNRLRTGAWRWWSYEPMRIDWLSTFLLFAGTLVFGLNLLDSFLHGLSTQQAARLVWAPDVIGCVLFLVSGQLALAEVCHAPTGVRPHDLGWWIVTVNMTGSVLFMIAALADLVSPGEDAPVSMAISNAGTLAGALCFAVTGVLQWFERP
ncbi:MULTISPECIES: hypothetical protein [unclassified Streptomyces]|uniref:hypothetical protein n=1 Tax=unclassified Streptomyces TaxID=2593676 RepID=UPI000DABC066|nr:MULTISPECIES: hypothetical protein [unclassified Streptomyces]PZT75920.1 hypothetical protein DNK56_21230 [Streptomyces sp. AC1-42W]PZT80129.1 hypothetical protein DNK55_11455 [Streptomyces sp. AC1-42T]